MLTANDLEFGPPDGLRCDVAWFTAKPRTVTVTCGAVIASALLGYVGFFKPVDAALLVIGAVLVIAVLVRPLIGGLILVASVPALSGLAPGFPIPNVRITELLIGVVGGTILLSVRSRQAAPWGWLEWALLSYGALWAVMGTLNAVMLHEQMSLADWGSVLGQLQFFILYRAVRITLRTRSDQRAALMVLIGATVPVTLLAVLQQVHVPLVSSLIMTITGTGRQSTTAQFQRATGPFLNWAALAGYLLPVILVMCALGLRGILVKRRKMWAVVGVLATIALLLTAELSAILCLVVGVVVLGVRCKRAHRTMRWILLGTLVLALAVGPFIGQRIDNELSRSAGSARSAGVPQTLSYRWNIWHDQYFPAIGARPVTGYGVVLPSSVEWPYTESQYVTLLVEGGVPILVAFGFVAWGMFERSRRAERSTDHVDQALGSALLVSVWSTMAMCVIWPFLSNGGMPQMLWCLFAIATPAIAAPGRPPDRSPSRARRGLSTVTI